MIWKLAKEQPAEELIRIGQKYGVNPAISKILLNRGIDTDEKIEEYFNGDLSLCHNPSGMKDMEKACDILKDKISRNQPIRVVGDYDVDGVTSTYILYDGLKKLGAQVSYDIPDRMTDGYGINDRIIEDAYNDGVDTIITCDNGISAFSAIEKARNCDMTVIVTDHHEVKYERDNQGNKIYLKVAANAIVDMKQAECKYPFKGLCGAGVAYKVLKHLYKIMNQEWGDERRYLDFLALGTACDIMDIADENRVFVKYGMKQIEQTDNIGLRALVKACGLEGDSITSYMLGFVLGPCINSCGRLSSACMAMDLFTTENEEQADALAEEIVQLNVERKRLTKDAKETGIEIVTRDFPDDNILVVYMPDIHESICGLVAGNIKEEFGKPVIVVTDCGNGMVKGSARSIEAFDMFEALVEVEDILEGYGGHKLAAGLGLKRENIDLLRQRLNEMADFSEEDLEEKIEIDLHMPMWYPMENDGLIYDLSKLEPFGPKNEPPVFYESKVKVEGISFFGKDNQCLNLLFRSPKGRQYRAKIFDAKTFIDSIKIWFDSEECDRMLNGEENNILLDIIYEPNFNFYNGVNYPQIIVRKYRKYIIEE